MFTAPAAFFAGLAFGIMFTALGLMADERKAKKVNKNRRRKFTPATL